MSTSQSQVLPQVSEATLISIACRIKQKQPINSEDLKRRSELQEALESFSKKHDGFPGDYGLGEEDANLCAEFKPCFNWAIIDGDMIDAEVLQGADWVCSGFEIMFRD